ncbi:hypothetical protein TNIN_60391 [Trichonephila inaurata madagascariensis]|uniref:Reverse transcriptase domain-containing protein n=1 Tax=Trichonephila inaurata madagascariensis TaxID=2747483 RepID=A0A8X6JGQ5_9ARAC|nr:hypothetical protein TNIN_398571 [Trichonephila inaurata madagascariensis]GFS63846.1 hypothetical protein TNIN_60391 [Trichonephila inaurata madagascariensis]
MNLKRKVVKILLLVKTFQVPFTGTEQRQTRQGLPEGAVLSPILFNLMYNDLIELIPKSAPGVNILLFADDRICHFWLGGWASVGFTRPLDLVLR